MVPVKGFTQSLDYLLSEFEQRLRQSLRSDVEFVQLIEEDLVSAGGKRIRPKLAFLASEALSGPGAMELALSVELLHSASLLHDDLIDDADTRRGKEAAFRKYGNAVSVLSGDYLLSRLMHLLATTGSLELVSMFAETARQLSEGEVLQFQTAALGTYSLANYERIIDGKTASVMRVACEGAAVLAKAPGYQREALARFGSLYGQAFQMRDDYLDLMGSSQTLGKPAGSDVREGKLTCITLPLLSNPEARAILDRRAAQPQDIERLKELAQSFAPAVIQTINDRVAAATACLSALPPSPAKDQLEQLALGELVRQS
jgi:octaprenyl-diphosphate synthase